MAQTRTVFGLMIVAIGAVFGSLQSMQLSSQLQADPWGVASAEKRFAPLLPNLPLRESVGYISDLGLNQQSGSTAFLAAQYVLAPRLLVPAGRQQNPEFAVGNFSQPQNYAQFGRNSGYMPVEDFGNGVILYRAAQR
jgi:hypothetical protein